MASETQGDKRPVYPTGFYEHTESGTFIEALSTVQADAFVRQGFTYLGKEAPKVKTTKDKE